MTGPFEALTPGENFFAGQIHSSVNKSINWQFIFGFVMIGVVLIIIIKKPQNFSND